MARKRKEHDLPGQIVMLRGLAGSPHAKELVQFIEKVTEHDGEVAEAKCWREYRNTMNHAVSLHIAHLEKDPEDRGHLISQGRKILQDSLGRLNACLVEHRERRR